MADKAKNTRIAIAKEQFYKHLPKVKAGTMTSTQFRAEVITSIMTKGNSPMNSAATMYQLVRTEAQLNGDLKGIELGKKAKAPKPAKAPKAKKSSKPATKSSKPAAKKSSKPATKSSKSTATKSSKNTAKKSTARKSSAAANGGIVQSDPDGTWGVTNGTDTTYMFSNRERARTAKGKLGEGWIVQSPAAIAAAATVVATVEA